MFDTPSLRSRIKLIAAGLIFGMVLGFLPEPIGTLGFWEEHDRMLLERITPALPGMLIGGFVATLTLPMIIRWYLCFIEQEKWLESAAIVHTISDLLLFVVCVSAPALLIQLRWQNAETWSTWGAQLVYTASVYLGMKPPTIRLLQSIGRSVPGRWRMATIALMLMAILACAIIGIYCLAIEASRWITIAMLNLGAVMIGFIWLLVAAWLCEEMQTTCEDHSAAEESSS